MTDHEKRLLNIADRTAVELFTDSTGMRVNHLVLMEGAANNRGGWGLGSVQDLIMGALREAVRKPTRAEVAAALLASPDTTRDQATKDVVTLITELETELAAARGED